MGTKMANEWFLHKTLKDEQELVTYKKKMLVIQLASEP